MKGTKKFIYIFFIIILLADLSYSFLEYYNTPFDGDMAGGIVPAEDVQKIFEDPFGISVILKNEKHPNPNRFFAHLFFKEYFQNIPLFLQKIVTPINSVYFASAIIKLLVQVLFIYLLSSIISKTNSIFNIKFLTVAVLIIPLFQAFGYVSLRIIDQATTYFFFYSLPLVLLILFLSFFYKVVYDNKEKISILSHIILILLTIILPFSGPLVSPIILIVSLLIFIKYYKSSNLSKFYFLSNFFKNTPKILFIYLIPISMLSLYSLWLGTYNTTYQTDVLPLMQRYAKLPIGLFFLFADKIGLPVLSFFIIINIFVIKKHYNTNEGNKIINSFKWIGVFALLYILLLPLGGYRPYRPNIIRFDTFMPITIGLIYLYGISSYFLLKNIKKRKYIYIAVTILFFLIYTNSDKSKLNGNKCEKESLQLIANSTDSIVLIENNCKILSWEVITDYKKSELNAKLIKLWQITEQEKLYYHK